MTEPKLKSVLILLSIVSGLSGVIAIIIFSIMSIYSNSMIDVDTIFTIFTSLLIALFIYSISISLYMLKRFSEIDNCLKMIGPSIASVTKQSTEKWDSMLLTDACGVNSKFWKRFSQYIVDDEFAAPYLPWITIEALNNNEVKVPKSLIYRSMLLMCDCMSKNDSYFATMELSELDNESSNSFLLDSQPKAQIKRVILVKSKDDFSSLTEQNIRKLKQQIKNGVELVFVINPGLWENFGIYGKLATGELDKNGWNVYKFNKEELRKKMENWAELESLGFNNVADVLPE